jgi:hypothetical protein
MRTAVAGVRVRSEPSIADTSRMLSPLLPVGTELVIVDGPKTQDGYKWWQVVPLTFAGLGFPGYGWVASASRDGVPWLEPAEVGCPPVPFDVSTLAALPSGVALACFARRPITVDARLVQCMCEVDGPETSPAWFGMTGGPVLLVERSVMTAPLDPRMWFPLHLDPDAGVGAVPVGQVAQVTGIFDHPSAEACMVREPEQPAPAPSLSCRLVFAVTAMHVIEP